MVYAVYIDVLAVNNFFVDLAALTAVNILLKKGCGRCGFCPVRESVRWEAAWPL